MKLTKKAEYAVRALLYISTHKEKEVVLTREIAENMDIPKQFLAQIMLILSKAGFVRAIRGANGGFVLRKAPSKISLLDVIEVIEGKLALNNCMASNNKCKRIDVCPVHSVWVEAQESILQVFKKADFEKMAKDYFLNVANASSKDTSSVSSLS